MACPINEDELKKLKSFVDVCSANPVLLNLPQLSFFKAFIEKMGGTVPSETSFRQPGPPPKTTPEADSEPDSFSESEPEAKIESETEESDVDIDREGCVEPDILDDAQKMGDVTKTPTEEEEDQASDIRAKAAKAYSEQNFDQAISLYTDAIQLNPTNALFYAKRGQAFLKLNKPNACIRDCDRALELNCDSAAAYKFRGRAHRLLGNWESSVKDLRQACKIDFDEEADEWLREVTPNAKKIEMHYVKLERKKAEKDLRERQERVKKAQKANEKAKAKAEKGSKKEWSGMGGGMPFSNPEILEAIRDPEVAAAFQDIMTNPGNIMKYQNNPKVMKLVTLVGQTMGQGGMGMGGMGGMGMGMPNFGEGTGAPKRSADFQDDGLD